MDATRTFYASIPRLNASEASEDQDLIYVRLDDRGDLGCYVWTGCEIRGPVDAAEEAEDYAHRQGWSFDEEDVCTFDVQEDVFNAALRARA